MRKVGRRSKMSMSSVRASCGILYRYFFFGNPQLLSPSSRKWWPNNLQTTFVAWHAIRIACKERRGGVGSERERGTTPFHLSLVAHSCKLVRHISCNCNCNSYCCYCNCNSSNNNNNKDSLSVCFLNQRNEPATGWQSQLIRQRRCLPFPALTRSQCKP